MALIEQQKALDAIEKCHKKCCRTDSSGDEWIHYETTLNEIESIKPKLEVIHCKDCKYTSGDDYCHCKYVTWWNNPDDYCSRAEKRGEENEQGY